MYPPAVVLASVLPQRAACEKPRRARFAAAMVAKPEELVSLLVQALRSANEGTSERSGRRLDLKFMRVHDFEGQPERWPDWVFGFKRAVRAASKEAYDILDEVERSTVDVDEVDLEVKHVDVNVEKLSGELYDILCQVCTGEAMSVIRAVDDCKGFLAWQKLHKKCNPRTMARAIRLMAEVASPPKVQR